MARTWLFYPVFLCGLACATEVYAEPNAAPAGGVQAKRAELEARLKKWRGTTLRRDVGLDEKKASDVERTLDRLQAERDKAQKDLRQQQKTLRALFDLDSSDQAAYAKALQSVREDTAKLQALRLAEFDELGKQLTPKQEAKLLRLMRQMEQKLRDAVRRFKKGHDAEQE
jgi:Spy/CpxP family protein refolding chaperone